MSAAIAAEIQPLHVFAWIVDSGLRDSLKSLAHAILRRVDRHTWRWPRRHGSMGGVTVADLADGAGLSRRHAARCLRALEEMGLVRTTFRPFEVSEYQLLPDAWRSRADHHRSARQADKARTRAARISAFNARREAAANKRLAGPADRPAPASATHAAATQRPGAPGAAAQTAAPSPEPPRWAWRHARRLDTTPQTVFQLVGGAAAAVLDVPEEAASSGAFDPRAQGGFARPVLRLWDDRGRPDPDQLVDELRLVAHWARASVHPDAVALRGAGRSGGADRSRDPRALCLPADFEQRLTLARGHAAARSPSATEDAQPAPDPAPPPLPALGEPPWIPPGQPPFLPGMAPTTDSLPQAWRGALQHLRRAEDQDRGAIDIFLAPLRPVAVQDGVVVLAAGSADGARWVGRHLTEALAVLAESLGAPIGLVVDGEAG